MNYISFDVLYVLPSVKFKDSYYVLVVDNFFRWGLSVYYAFHDQPEEDSGPFVYYCLNRDNAKMRFSYLPQSFDTYVENVMPGFFQFRPILQQLLSIGRIQVKLDLQYQKVSGFLVDTQHNQKLVNLCWYSKGF